MLEHWEPWQVDSILSLTEGITFGLQFIRHLETEKVRDYLCFLLNKVITYGIPEIEQV